MAWEEVRRAGSQDAGAALAMTDQSMSGMIAFLIRLILLRPRIRPVRNANGAKLFISAEVWVISVAGQANEVNPVPQRVNKGVSPESAT